MTLLNKERDLEADRPRAIVKCVDDWPQDDQPDDIFNDSVRGILLYWIYKFNVDYQCFKELMAIDGAIANLHRLFKYAHHSHKRDLDEHEYLKLINNCIQTIWQEIDNKIFEKLKK